MLKRLAVTVSVAVALVAFAVFTEALRLMNQPSTERFWLGIAIILALVVTVPSIVTLIVGRMWRRKNDHVRQIY